MPSSGEASPTPGPVPVARRGGLADVAELVRLRALMFASMTGPAVAVEADDGWRAACARDLATKLATDDGSFAAFVVDDGAGGLAACVVGMVEPWLPAPGRANGRVGHLGSVSTDPRWRRRGLARAVVTALVEWFDAAGVRRTYLHATGDGDRLYRSLGFTEPPYPELRRDR